MEPIWLRQARKYIGEKEVEGAGSNPDIVRWWKLNELKYTTDGPAWCANFVGGMLEEVGIHGSHREKARSYLEWGKKLDQPAVGSIVVFWRKRPDNKLGHVAFVVGRDQFGNLMALGGNQHNSVNILPFDNKRILGYRWPSRSVPKKSHYNLPLIKSDGKLSKQEV